MDERKWVIFPACEKCGATVPRVRWNKGLDGHGLVEEHFHLKCRRCGFRWIQEAKDDRRA